MSTSKYSTLSADELKEARGRGLPSDVDSRFVVLNGKNIVFTIKGIQYYKYVLEYWGVSANLGAIKTVVDLLNLTLVVNDKMQFPHGMPYEYQQILSGKRSSSLSSLKKRISAIFK